MAKATMSNVIDRLRRALLAGGDVDLTDGELLELFVNRRDEAAVAALVRRYGTMVWSVCRRILRNHHDAEDAFQATFLVLVRKGSSVRPREMLAAWLHGVARQTALKARATTAKRQGREKQVMAMPEPQAPRHEESWSDLQPLLDQELARLHDKYRVAILLCELEGKSRKEAARQLGIPEGTLSSRLTTARRMLAKRLARHGLAHSAGGLALLLSQKVDASVPSSLISATIKAASLVAAGKSVVAGAVSAKVAALTEVVVKAMLLSKLKTLVMLLGTLGVMTLTLGFAAYHGFAQQSASETARAQVRKPDARKDLPAMPHLDRNGDALPPGAITRLGSARFRNSDRVVHLIYSPDGKVMAAACWDGSVRLWDASTGKLRWHLETDKENGPGRTPFPQSIQHVLAFSSDGKDLAMLNRSGYTVLNTDAARVVVRHDWPALYDAKQDAESFAIAPDLTTFAVKFFDGSVQIHDSVSGQQKWRFMTELKAFPQKMTFSADGKALYVLAYRGQKRLVTAYDATSGRVVDTWNADGQIENMALSRDSRHLVVVGSRVFLWDLKSGKERHEIKLPVPFAHAAAFSPEGNTLAVTNGWDVLFFDTATRNQQRRMRLLSGAMSLAFSPDGNTLAAGEQCITQWKIATGELQAPIPEPGGAILRVQFQAGGNQLLAIGTQGASLWDVAGGQRVPLAALNEQLKPSLPLYWGSVSQNGRRLVVRGSADDLVLIDTATNQPLRTFKGRKEYGKSVVLSPDGTRLYSADYKRVIVWDVASGKTLRELESKFVSQVAISPDGRWLASWANGKYTPKPALGDYDVRVWDVTTGELVRRLRARSEAAIDAVFSPDSTRLAIVGGDPGQPNLRGSGIGRTNALQLWDVATGTEVRTFHGNQERATCIAFSPDGRVLATGKWDFPRGGASDHTIRLWEVVTGAERGHIEAHESAVQAVDFSPDGRLLAAASADAPVYIWDVYSLKSRLPQKGLNEADRDKLWQQLASGDAPVAFQAVCTLVAWPHEALAILQDRWNRRPRATAPQVQKWIEDLDSKQLSVRQEAQAELDRHLAGHEALLRSALDKASSIELRRRLEHFLDPVHPEQLRRTRMLEVLERIGLGKARPFLQTLAGQTEDLETAREAARALTRLERSSERTPPGF